MEELKEKLKEKLKGEYRFTVWPDANKDSFSTRDADLACLGFDVGFDACFSEYKKERIKQLEGLLGECEEALDQSLRQWDMYASNSQKLLEESDEIEGVLYRRYQEVYQKLKAAKEGK